MIKNKKSTAAPEAKTSMMPSAAALPTQPAGLNTNPKTKAAIALKTKHDTVKSASK